MNRLSVFAALCILEGSSIKLKYDGHSHGIPYSATMQEQPSHWRKVWPEGCVDNGDSDAETESFVPAGAYYDGQAVQLSAGGIPYHALMNEQPSHWRKVWPEGAVDNSDGDAEIIDRFNKEPPAKPDGPQEKYPWSYDEDVLATKASLKTGEKITGEELGEQKHGGLDLINTYDNTKVQFERNLPYGATWGDYKK